jgi:hypothetical protein
MKISNILFPPVLIAMAVGCQSHPTQTVSTTTTVTRKVTQTPVTEENAPASTAPQTAANAAPQQIITDNAIYTIKTIPNPRLSATSREGDKTNEVYSSNIIAVYVQPRNGGTVNSTNLSTAPSPEINPQQPQNK